MKKLLESLEQKIVSSYEEGVTVDQAEKLAGEFLYGQVKVSQALKDADLDSRMKKSGVKAIRAAIYMAEATKSEKKPTEAMLAALIDSNDLVMSEQNSLDQSEVSRDELERYYNIFNNAHIHFRGIAKGSFGG